MAAALEALPTSPRPTLRLEDSNRPPVLGRWGAGLSVLALFVAVHSPIDRVVHALLAVQRGLGGAVLAGTARAEHEALLARAYVQPLRQLLFVVGVVPLLIVILRALAAPEVRRLLRAVAPTALVACLICAVLAVPFRGSLGVAGMGEAYLKHSLQPFATGSGWYYRRLLTVGLANVTGLSGGLYYPASLGLTLALTVAVAAFTRARLRLTGMVQLVVVTSICTSQFVFFAFLSPGYVEPLGFALLLVPWIAPTQSEERLACWALVLSCHEALAVALLPLLIVLEGRDRLPLLALLALYGLLLMLSFGFDLGAILRVQTQLKEGSSWDFFRSAGGWLALAIFAAHKLLWLAIGGALVDARHARRARAFVAVAALLPLLTLPIAVDGSRMVGFGFLGVLAALELFARHASRRVLVALAALNLLIPSFYVGLNTGPRLEPGLYRSAVGLFLPRAS